MDDAVPCQFHDLSSVVFVVLAVAGGWMLERRRQREMQLTPASRTPPPWKLIVLYVWFTLTATYTTEFALRWSNGCTA